MSTSPAIERYQLELQTPVGPVKAEVDVPTGFVPLTAIVPLLQRLGEAAQTLEEQAIVEAGGRISCRKGCAACCRMLVPVSPPEALALRQHILALPDERRRVILERMQVAQRQLEQASLLSRLWAVADMQRPLRDEEMEPINRDYYALRLPCPFLEDECCSLYESRPSACRELQVTSPPELCQDLVRNPVEAVPVSIRTSTVLGLLWSDVSRQPPRLIPLPIAVDWAAREQEAGAGWKGAGTHLFQTALEYVSRFLHEEFANRQHDKAAFESKPESRPVIS